jgi:hypothetical protein
MPVTGWKLDKADRAALLQRFPPSGPNIIADHVTLDAKADDDTPLPAAARAQIIGGIDDGEGLQAMVVAIDGASERPDGGTFHITWSLDRSHGREPAESNAVIAQRGWRPLDDPVPIRIMPARWP